MNRIVNINELINDYRDTSRTLWNQYLRINFNKFPNIRIDECFREINYFMFRCIVLAPVLEEIPDDYFLGFECNFIKVRLKSGKNLDICREKGDSCGYWDHQIDSLRTDVDLNFIDLFDWNPFGVFDMSLVKAKIVKCEEYPDLVGHRLLVQFSDADIELCLESYNEADSSTKCNKDEPGDG